MDTDFPPWHPLALPPAPRPDARRKTLWQARWNDRGASIVTALDKTEAMHRIHVLANAPGTNTDRDLGSIDAIEVVADFEMRVADGNRKSKPRWYRSRLCQDAIRWFRPGDETGEAAMRFEAPPLSYRIWGYIWCEGDVVIFTAPDVNAARRRVAASAASWGLSDIGDTEAVTDDVEPIDRFEMELESSEDRLIPVSYRVWAGEFPFTWPTLPRFPDDDDRVSAETRLPIPTYKRVGVRTRERGATWTRRSARPQDLSD